MGSKQGIFVKKDSGEIVFQEKDLDTKEITEKTPEQCGLAKSVEFDLYFCKEVENEEEFEVKTQTFFRQTVKISVREAYNLWLKLSDRKYFVIDVLNGMCLMCPFESDSNLSVEKSRPKKVSLEEVKEAQKDKTRPFYFFGKIEISDGEISSYGVTV